MVNQSTYKKLKYIDLGLIGYQEAWDLQKDIYNLRLKNEIEDRLLLLEHPNTYTLGKTSDVNNLLAGKAELKLRGIAVFEIDRGGDITYHGPGQIVGYSIIDLSNWKKDTHLYLRSLEEVIIRTCGEYGLKCERKEKYTGVWINDRKIAAIGVKISRWITMHGFAFNVNTDLTFFDGIIPCGIKNKEVTSLNKEVGEAIDLAIVKQKLINNFCDVFEYNHAEEIRLGKESKKFEMQTN